MAQEKQEQVKKYDKAAALMMQTKNGKGYKIVVNGNWFYTSTKEMADFANNKSKAVNFRSVQEIKDRANNPAPTGVTQ
jgi:formylmethanofuran dehydrogenase subunit E